MGSYKRCLEAAMIVLMVLDTFVVGLRIMVRTLMVKAFGLDDIVLFVAYLGYMLGCGFGFTAIHFGFAADPGDDERYFDEALMMQFYAANQYTLYISSGIIKIAVALVLYRLACGLRSQATLVISIIAVVIWTFITTLFAMDLCATTGAASYTGTHSCTGIGYFRMVSNVFVDYFFALYPIPMLWNATLSQRMKIIVCSLLSLGIVASGATIAKLVLLIKLETATGVELSWLHIQLLTWADVELGLAIFCAAIAALRPLFRVLTGHKTTKWSGTTMVNSPDRGHQLQTFTRDNSRRAFNMDNDQQPGGSSHNTSSGKGPFRSDEYDMSSIETTIRHPLAQNEDRIDTGSVGDYHEALHRSNTAHRSLGRRALSRTDFSSAEHQHHSDGYRLPRVPGSVKVRNAETG